MLDKEKVKTEAEKVLSELNDEELSKLTVHPPTHYETWLGKDVLEDELIGNLFEHYNELYRHQQKTHKKIVELERENKKWRKRTWAWRISTFILGLLIGSFLSSIF